jgi:phage tail-like protein
MPEFPVNPKRLDPYKGYRFRVLWDGHVIAGVMKVSPLARATDVVVSRRGTEPSVEHRSPGLSHYEQIVLERGVSQDRDFELWAEQVWNLNAEAGKEMSADFRKDVIVELLNEAGQVAARYKALRCWPSHYTALANLDADSSAVAMERLVLENEGWVRDHSTAEPQEPSY